MHLNHQLNHLYCDDDGGNDNIAAKVEPCLFFACRIDDPDISKESIIYNEKYIYNQHLKRIYHPPMHNEFLCDHLVGSCNGLVCAFQFHHLVLDPIYICNPLTREYVYLPQLVVKKEEVVPDFIDGGEVEMHHNTACGFGYVRSTNEYKIVRIHYPKNAEGDVEVYTLGSGCGWRAIGRVPYHLSTLRGGKGTYANDVIYWTSGNKVVAFDLADEEFRLLSVPPCMQNLKHGDKCGLAVLGRHLCLYVDNKLWKSGP
ncbi:F-box protein At3g07870-like [Papaver somniferum]|uniref:F-box protein At3g07870-like n=1 Tax=Papaver somniferum TaxID=3469 RepID=UPI000E6FF5AE|nr:F-box protein At3g07870-like [Papaver somniferum]XP_026431293.1 F-box protein At3g07870-like [Papaver somniferum]